MKLTLAGIVAPLNDDPSEPTFTDLKLLFYYVDLDDEYRSESAVSESIPLSATTSAQTLSIPQETSEDEPYYMFDFDSVHSYDILNGDEVLYQDNIDFVDTDPPGEITGVSNLHCSVDASSGSFYLVLQLDYTDDYDKLSSFYISVTPDQAGAEASSNASIIKSTNYQLAVFEDTSSTGNQGVISYLDGGGTSFTVNIYNWNDQQIPIYTEENVTIYKETSNIFYSAKISTTEFSPDDYEFRFDELVYVCGDPSHLSTAQIIFNDESTGREAFKWDFPLGNPSYLPPSFSLMDAVLTSSGSAFEDYNDIVSQLSGKTFEIVIQFINRAGTSFENYPIAS